MKSILVLYPIQPYVDVLTRNREKARYARIYQNLIHKRYPGFQLIWMMFSESQSPEKPDMSQLWQGISIGKDDIVGACGVSFSEHCKKEIYPNPETILSFCPRPIEQLVIAGFHFWDCVEKVAKRAHEKGINVLADDDLTEFFFWRAGIPSSREKSIEKERKQLVKSGSFYLNLVRNARKGKPWLVSI